MNEQQKSPIDDDEIYRNEARKKIACKQSSESKIWKFVNSNFVIFLLSSVVLSLITTLYSSCQNERAKMEEKEKLIKQLDNEISNRIYQLLFYTRLIKIQAKSEVSKNDSIPSDQVYAYAVKYLNNEFIYDTDPKDFSIYYDYRYRNFRSLVFELSTLLEGKEYIALGRVINTYERLLDSGSVNGNGIFRKEDFRFKYAVHYLDSITKSILLLPRWHSKIYEL